nr:hypothetical protein [Tanacetum cinerariifolium]
MAASSPVCLMSKETLTKSWLWHPRLLHLNFGTINDLTRLDLVDGLPKFKYGKPHLCFACERGKRKKASHPPKLVPKADEFHQHDSADFDGNAQFVPYNPPSYEAVESSSTALEPSNVQNFHQELVPRPKGKNIITLKWLWKNKCDAKNIVVQNKTLLVANGYRLKKALYGLKQAHRAWYDKLSFFRIKHGFTKDECVSIRTPMETERLDDDLQGTPTDQTTYRRMIGGLMYLTASHPDIAYATFVCARYQARPTVKYLKEVKWIFRYLRHSYNMGLWYLKDSGFELIAYSDADHAGCKDDCKNTSGGLQFLVIIMAQQQNVADVHLNDLCPLNKQYDLIDANKKIDLERVQCPPESKILMNIIKNHPLRFSIAASSFLPWIYMAQFWHTLKEDGSTYRLKFMPELLRERIHYSLHQSTSLIPCLRFTKIIVGHYMTNFLKISRRARDKYHNLKVDDKLKRWWNDKRMSLMIVQSLRMMNTIFSALEEEEITDEVYELKQREKGKIVKESRNTPFATPIRSPWIYTDLVSSDTKNLHELTITDTKSTPSSSSPSTKELQGRYGFLFEHIRVRFMPRKSFATLVDHLKEVMVDSLPTMVEKHVNEHVQKQVPKQVRDQVPQQDITIWLALQMKFRILQVPQTTCRTFAVRLRDQDDPHDDTHPEGRIVQSGRRHLSNQVQVDDYDFCTESYASDDDEIPTKQVSQDIMKEVSLTIDEAKLNKIDDEMLRQRCTLGVSINITLIR